MLICWPLVYQIVSSYVLRDFRTWRFLVLCKRITNLHKGRQSGKNCKPPMVRWIVHHHVCTPISSMILRAIYVSHALSHNLCLRLPTFMSSVHLFWLVGTLEILKLSHLVPCLRIYWGHLTIGRLCFSCCFRHVSLIAIGRGSLVPKFSDVLYYMPARRDERRRQMRMRLLLDTNLDQRVHSRPLHVTRTEFIPKTSA